MTVAGTPTSLLSRALRARAGALSGVPHDTAVLADRPDGTVVRSGGLVVKAHAADTDSEALAQRLAVAAHPLLAGILLPPLAVAPGAVLHGRPVTVWPFGAPVDRHTDPDDAPWEAAGALLARLHSTKPPAALPPMRGPAKAAKAVARMGAADPDPDPAVLRAWSLLPGWVRDEAPQPHAVVTLCHGDLHLGQLVRHPAPCGAWQLIDVDDLGLGVPAWDLARPAMWFAAGVLPPHAWDRFLGAYRAAGGPAVPADGDPWPYLDIPARALAVQTAAIALAKRAEEGRVLDETEQAVLDTCRRIAEVS